MSLRDEVAKKIRKAKKGADEDYVADEIIVMVRADERKKVLDEVIAVKPEDNMLATANSFEQGYWAAIADWGRQINALREKKDE